MSAFRLIDPDEKLTFPVEWSSWLATSDSISTVSWVITPTGPTVTNLGSSGTIASASVEGCTRGAEYRLTCDMVSADGETGQQSIILWCDHR